MRFPGLKGSPSAAIVGFLRETRRALRPYKTMLGASVFGIAATRPDQVAQDVPAMARQVDYIAPLVYPSHWGRGEYNVSDPNAEPFAIVETHESVVGHVLNLCPERFRDEPGADNQQHSKNGFHDSILLDVQTPGLCPTDCRCGTGW